MTIFEFIRSGILRLYGIFEKFLVAGILIYLALYGIHDAFTAVGITSSPLIAGQIVIIALMILTLSVSSGSIGGINSVILGTLSIIALSYSIIPYSIWFMTLLSCIMSFGAFKDNKEKQGWAPELLLLATLMFSQTISGIVNPTWILINMAYGIGFWVPLLLLLTFWFSAAYAAKQPSKGNINQAFTGVLFLILGIVLIWISNNISFGWISLAVVVLVFIYVLKHPQYNIKQLFVRIIPCVLGILLFILFIPKTWIPLWRIISFILAIMAGYKWTDYLREAAKEDIKGAKTEMNDANKALESATASHSDTTQIRSRVDKANDDYRKAIAHKSDPTGGISLYCFFLWNFLEAGGRWLISFNLPDDKAIPNFIGRKLLSKNWDPSLTQATINAMPWYKRWYRYICMWIGNIPITQIVPEAPAQENAQQQKPPVDYFYRSNTNAVHEGINRDTVPGTPILLPIGTISFNGIIYVLGQEVNGDRLMAPE